jgi:6,7-dimethyl-8-ribityllumazine synthase
MQTLYSAAQALEFDRPVRLLALVSLELDAKRRDIIAQQIAQVLDIPQVRCDVIEMPNTMALRAAVSLGHRLGDYDGYVVFDNHTDGAGWDQALSLFAAQGMCIQLCHGTMAPEQFAEHLDTQVNAALHLVALTRKWSAQQGSAGFRAPSQRYNLATGGTTV